MGALKRSSARAPCLTAHCQLALTLIPVAGVQDEGPLEVVNGVLMLGMSAATLMAIVQPMITLLRDARADAGTGSGP